MVPVAVIEVNLCRGGQIAQFSPIVVYLLTHGTVLPDEKTVIGIVFVYVRSGQYGRFLILVCDRVLAGL